MALKATMSFLRSFQFNLSHWASSKCVWIRLIYSHFCLYVCVSVYVSMCIQMLCGCSGQLAATCRVQLRQKKVNLSLLHKCPISPNSIILPSLLFCCDINTRTFLFHTYFERSGKWKILSVSITLATISLIYQTNQKCWILYLSA